LLLYVICEKIQVEFEQQYACMTTPKRVLTTELSKGTNKISMAPHI